MFFVWLEGKELTLSCVLLFFEFFYENYQQIAGSCVPFLQHKLITKVIDRICFLVNKLAVWLWFFKKIIFCGVVQRKKIKQGTEKNIGVGKGEEEEIY